MYINNHFSIICFFISAYLMSFSENKINSVPFCRTNNNSLLLVSTLDGRFTALNIENDGLEEWSIDTEPGPLLSSSIHSLELSENSQWIRMIPSLNGGLYKFNGEYIQPVPINADSLLSTSFLYSDNVVISGGKEVQSLGIDASSGKVLYQCSMSRCDNFTNSTDNFLEVIVLQRSTQTIRAIEPYGGHERWNYSVSQHDVKLLPNTVAGDCKLNQYEDLDIDIKVIVPDGLIFVLSKSEPQNILWQHKFSSPIANMWSLVGQKLEWIDLFSASYTTSTMNNEPVDLNPSLYIGMHNKQLYIQESAALERYFVRSCGLSFKSDCAPKLPWIPFPATEDRLRLNEKVKGISQLVDENSSTTALSVLYGSEYVNGNGYYLYDVQTTSEADDSDKCLKRKEVSDVAVYSNKMNYVNAQRVPKYQGSVIPLSFWWKEIVAIGLTIAFVLNFICNRHLQIIFYCFLRFVDNKKKSLLSKQYKEITETDSGVDSMKSNVSNNENGVIVSEFTSRFLQDFEPLSILGKGGFGIVFEAKNRIDDCHYAIKRITLPNRNEARERVMREVKALAKLEHQNIVRYFNAWQECPPTGWQEKQDKIWLNKIRKTKFTTDDSSMFHYQTNESKNRVIPLKSTYSKRSTDSAINFNIANVIRSFSKRLKDETESDSFIVFDDSKTDNDDSKIIAVENSLNSKSASTVDHRPLREEEKQPRIYLYIQMQLCQQNSLREWLQSNTVRERSDIFLIFEQIVQAVEYVHMQGLIHRDLKPSNIFFSPDGQIKVGDFGLVTEMIETEYSNAFADQSYECTNHTARVGTRLYMSPEQLNGMAYSYKVDIYSLGIILFELLIPFSTEMERCTAIAAVRSGKFPANFMKDYEDEYNLLTLMLSQFPESRPTTYGVKFRLPFKRLSSDADLYEDWHFELPNRTGRSRNSNSFSQYSVVTHNEIITCN